MLFDKFKKFFTRVKAGYYIADTRYLLSHERYQEAFSSLEKIKFEFIDKYFDYHMLHAQLVYLATNDLDIVVNDLEKAISLLEKDEKIFKRHSVDERNYLISWCLSMLTHCYTELGHLEKAKKYAVQKEEYVFDLKIIRKYLKRNYPMGWKN